MVCLWNHCSGWTFFFLSVLQPDGCCWPDELQTDAMDLSKESGKECPQVRHLSIHHLVAFRNLFKCELMQQRCIRVGKAGNCLIAYIFTRGGGWHLNLNFTSLLLFMCMHHWRCTDGWCAFTSAHYPKIRAAILQILRHSLCRSSQGMDSLLRSPTETGSTNPESVSTVNHDVSPCFYSFYCIK